MAKTSAQRQAEFRRRSSAQRAALAKIDQRLDGNDKPLAVEIRAIAREALEYDGQEP